MKTLLIMVVLAVLAVSSAAHGDVIVEGGELNYEPFPKKWRFYTPTNGVKFPNVTEKALGKQLTKNKGNGNLNWQCLIEYDTDSRIGGRDGDYYSIFSLKKCD